MQSFFKMVINFKWITLITVVLILSAAASGLGKLAFSSDYRMFFKADNPEVLAFDTLQNTYTKNDNVLFILTPKDGEVFTSKNLEAVEFLTKEAWQIPFSLRVDSISNFQHSYAQDDDLIVEDLVEGAINFTSEELSRAKNVAISEPLLLNRLISPSAHVTGINVTVQMPEKDFTEVFQIANFSRELARQVEEKFPFMEVRLSGLVFLNAAFPEASQKDVATLYPLMFIGILITLGFLLRSVTATVATFAVILFTIVGTMGITGWMGITLSPPTMTTPIIIMTLAVADCVHILVSFFYQMKLGHSKADSLLESLRINIGPIFLTSLTTAIGFLSFSFSESPPFQDLGYMAAIGVSLAFVFSITILPAIIMILPVKTKLDLEKLDNQVMINLAEFIVKRKNPIFWGMALISILLISQLPKNELNDEFVKYFDTAIDFRVDTDYATDNLTGIYLIDYSLDAGEAGGISEPEYLNNLEKFANWYREQPRVLHVNTYSDTMKRLNKNMHGDDEQWYRLPAERDLAAQYLLLYEFSLPFGLDLNNQINIKKSSTRMTVTFESLSTIEILAMQVKAQEWMLQNLPEVMYSPGASPSVMFAHLGEKNIKSMLKGTTVALFLISATLIFALRSLRIGLLSLMPNLVPAAMAFGLWGLLVGQVGLALSVVTGMTLGIVVDDTIHFLSKYLRAKREKGLNTEDAIRYTFKTVGMALWVTSLVLIIGFSVLTLSHFELNSGMGLLTAIVIAFALFADFFLLSTLLLKFEGGKND